VSSQPPLPPPAGPPVTPRGRGHLGRSGPAPGWYPDPAANLQAGHWRWWDGRAWTAYAHATAHKPRLPAWLSVPVLVGAVLIVPTLAVSLVLAPVATLLSIPTFVAVLAVFVWFDRLEPEPWQERIHAVLWGGTIAVLVAGSINSVVGVLFGEAAAVVLSAPIVEEAMKGLGILYAVRRRTVDSVTDGIVYAGWIAAGFAAVENVQYFLLAAGDGQLAMVFVLRGVLAPFAHPLFTLWIGVGIGTAVVRGRSPVLGALPGYVVAVVLHALWNGASFLAITETWLAVLAIVGGFVLLFVVTATLLLVQRLRARDRLAALVPVVAQRYGLTAPEVAIFSDWRRTLAVRRQLSGAEKRAFDARHAAISRLVALHDRSVPVDPAREAELVARLWESRQGS
jgi:RsiW-degrading membrane proteinase PrsW (M82 family)